MKDIVKNIIMFILIIIICIMVLVIYNLYKNYNLIKKIDEANLSYIGSEEYHINIKTTIYMNGEDVSTSDTYKKDGMLKTTYSNNDTIHYETTGIFESFDYSPNDNKIIGTSTSYADGFIHFLETYYRHFWNSKITSNNEYYILTIENYKYYFDKATYRIAKEELLSDTNLIVEIIYTYYDNEEITYEMVSRPVI